MMLKYHARCPAVSSYVKPSSRLITVPKLRTSAPVRKHHFIVSKAVVTADAFTWDNVKRETASELKDYVLRKGQSPASAPNPTLPTKAGSYLTSTKPVVLFRDTNAWCPYCARVWMALEYKQVPYDTVLINLRDKPEWYTQLVPSKLVPAVSFSGEVLSESKDILLALEERFPSPPLLPEDPDLRQEALALLEELSEVQVDAAGFKYIAGGPLNSSEKKDPAQLPQHKAEFERGLQWMEDKLAKHEGPFFMGSQLTIVDICMSSGLSRSLSLLPSVRNYNPLQDPAYPGLQAWMAALLALPAYQKVRSDPETLLLVFGKLFNLASGEQKGLAGLSEEEINARREVAAKLYANRDAIVQDIVSKSGLSRPRGSRYGQTMYSYNGYEAAPSPGIPEAVESALLWLASYLLSGSSTRPRAASKEAAAVSAVALAYFRNRASAPRDMTANAAVQLRAACDHLLTKVF